MLLTFHLIDAHPACELRYRVLDIPKQIDLAIYLYACSVLWWFLPARLSSVRHFASEGQCLVASLKQHVLLSAIIVLYGRQIVAIYAYMVVYLYIVECCNFNHSLGIFYTGCTYHFYQFYAGFSRYLSIFTRA